MVCSSLSSIAPKINVLSGIMFPIRAKAILPIEQIIIQSVAVRGNLGDISIWISNETTSKTNTIPESFSIKLTQKHWTKVYQNKHKASPRSYQTMDLTKFYDKPVSILPGQVRMMYIHSTLESDTGTFGYLCYSRQS